MMMEPVSWHEFNEGSLLPGKLKLLDQTQLPEKVSYVITDDIQVVHECIRRLVVRGAPAIGCAAALGLAAAAQKSAARTIEEFMAEVKRDADYLASARPTAVNLKWALDRCVGRLSMLLDINDVKFLKIDLLEEARRILEENARLCRQIGVHGAALLKDEMGVLTHCNAGSLATGGYGTALAPVYVALERGVRVTVYADETRPLLQGSRLTAWELMRAGADVVAICDNMAAQVMREGKARMVLVGADRIAANGDTANKIGTYGLAVLAKHHKIPFYVAAPYSTFDLSLPDGSGIPIEQRDPDEVRRVFGRLTAPPEVDVYNPAFDVTPASLITGIITEEGIVSKPYKKNIAAMVAGKSCFKPMP